MHWLPLDFQQYRLRQALIWRDQATSYGQLFALFNEWCCRLDQLGAGTGDAVAITGDYSPNTISVLLALAARNCVSVLISWPEAERLSELLPFAGVSLHLEFRDDELTTVRQYAATGDKRQLLEELRSRGNAGLVLFSSGSTGKAKAILLDFTKLITKMDRRRHGLTTLAFLVFGHIGGVNTLMRTLITGGTLVFVESRQAQDVCRAIELHGVQVLPTTPTFLAMLLISGMHERYDLSSLEMITYGTETMPESTIKNLRSVLPQVKLKQTYGLSELGILPTKSENSGSLFMKIGGAGIETKIVDNVLHIRADTAMLGYLNAASPFSDDGWYNTGDVVEVRGELLRIVGREVEIINVGGRKVFPAEVESVILEIPNVADAVVFGAQNPITGEVVRARVTLHSPEDQLQLQKRIKQYCRSRLEPFQVPVSVEFSDVALHSDRFKKSRAAILCGSLGVSE